MRSQRSREERAPESKVNKHLPHVFFFIEDFINQKNLIVSCVQCGVVCVVAYKLLVKLL